MNITNLLSEYCVQLAIGFIFIMVSKALFEESVVIDSLNIILVFVGAFIEAFFNQFTNALELLSYIAYIVLFVIFFRGIKKNRWKRIRAIIATFLTFAMAELFYCYAVAVIINPSILNDDAVMDDQTMNTLHITVTAMSIIVVVYIYFELVKKGICLAYKLKEKILMVFFEVAAIVLCGIVYDAYERGVYDSVPEQYKYAMIFLCALLFFGSNLFLIKNKLSVYYKSGQKYQQEMLELELRHFKQYKESQEETKRFRHDIINNLMAIQMLQSEGKSSEATEYVNELLGKVSDLSPKVVTGNDFLDSIISAKIETMEELGIKYEIDGVFDKGLKLSLVDICTIFSNALDNAIEACEALSHDRYFSMRIKRTNSFYMIAMENSMARDKDVTEVLTSKRFTTKKNKEIHGYGINNIKQTVAKYNGETTIDMQDGVFVLTIMLPVA